MSITLSIPRAVSVGPHCWTEADDGARCADGVLQPIHCLDKQVQHRRFNSSARSRKFKPLK